MRGIEVPSLGSPRDIVFRAYLDHEVRLESLKQKLTLLQTVGASANFADPNRKREWISAATKHFNDYISLKFGVEPKDTSAEEESLLEYYEKVVKPSKITLRKDKRKGLVAEGGIIQALKQSPDLPKA